MTRLRPPTRLHRGCRAPRTALALNEPCRAPADQGRYHFVPLRNSGIQEGIGQEVKLMGTPFRDVEEASLAAMTPEERASFDAALKVEEDRLRAAELDYVRFTAHGSHRAPRRETGHVEGVDSL
jgi:hypothetical protein